jgi:hypothetical protein|mmetsp:Transcript_17333/g.31295  ORF Transcript_17333/g.31295 Transcript_17333/m.31295 type:complete len:228 (-) Transcript_17333:244-927(-)|eukprot:CAMPEP_0198283812 /NCGR_PEP_ID=MMETSP1449-20131203/3408_1 /TAXON_ID=420275 /ORGANISM="Attheya septentrionalis, Strain CCMP2084" /LENGTH=227 /DNA_ID=CAMNT_0043980659 /DNA_START=150 /DNA_END=833 /DNA_ORIENTATION=-
MSNGGRYPWKVQKINTKRGPAADFSNLSKPLPQPPKGMTWVQDMQSREWSVEKVVIFPPGEASNLQSRECSVEKVVIIPPGEASNPEHQVATGVPVGPPILSQDYQDDASDASFLYHNVVPSDTFQGLCLRYGISPTVMRQTNHFSGSNLRLAPQKLKIPIGSVTKDVYGTQDTEESKIIGFSMAFKRPDGLSRKEAVAYLELSDWNVDEAIVFAKQDLAWESQHGN